MFYFKIALRGVRDVYTWESETLLNVGDRVQIKFRNTLKLGLVVAKTSKPKFKTAPVLGVVDKNFLPFAWVEMAEYLSQKHFTSLSKVLALMVPQIYWTKEQPAKYRRPLKLKTSLTETDLKHPTQKAFFRFLNSAALIWDDQIPTAFKATSKTFVKKEWLSFGAQQLKAEFSLLSFDKKNNRQNWDLTSEQTKALNLLLAEKQGSLLWGVTGSGKTEVYKHYFKKLQSQKPQGQFVLLLPEIALTPQLIEEFKTAFGTQIALWHSNLTANEKVQAYARLQTGEAKVLIGTRSAALVPIPNLAAIVVDEEHEWTFKNEFNPRFWTHEVVEFLAQKLKIPFIYGSATPKMRSYFLAQKNRLKLVPLKQRVHKVALPTIELVDLKQESKRGNFAPVSGRLQQHIASTLASGKQVVLFLNKRGYAGASMCRFCGDAFCCDHCDMALKLHKQGENQRLICHVCGSMKAFPKHCPSCKKSEFQFKGWGTQQLEIHLKQLFPGTQIFRADKDSITGRYDFETLLKNFKNTPQSILLGTQMIAKGLDFSSVTLVGIVMADVGLHLPDHNAEERVYQLLEQVSGRAGRRHVQGHIVVQTYQPELPLFKFLQTHNTQGFMQAKFEEHQTLCLPPFSQIAKVIVSDYNKANAFVVCKNLHSQLQQTLQQQNLSNDINVNWAPAFFPKLHGKYWFYVFLKSKDSKKLTDFMQNFMWPKGVKIDVSPTSLI